MRNTVFIFSSLAVLVGGIIFSSTQTTYYVATSGSDSNPGTQAQPWKTITKVNAHVFVSGESLYLNGGDTFTGNVLLAPATPYSSTVTISSYGTGIATISCGNAAGVKIVNSGNVTVSNLKISGNGTVLVGVYPDQTASTTTTEGGVYFLSDTLAVNYPNSIVSNCEILNTREGVYFYNTNVSATVAHSGLQVVNNYVHNIACHGIYLTGASDAETNPLFSSPVITGNRIEYVSGIVAAPGQEDGGFCVRVVNSSSALISGNLQKYSGWAATGFPTSTLIVFSSNPVIRSNELCFFGTHGGDGHGIDPDIGVTGAIVENNYIHDSDKYGLFNYAGTGSIYRYNIVERCEGGFRQTFGSSTVYNNTFWGQNNSDKVLSSGSAVSFYNNVVFATFGDFAEVGASSNFIGNTYYASDLTFGGFQVTIGGTLYGSFAAMRTAGYEKNAGINYGANGNPLVADGGNGTQQLMGNPVSQLAAYNISGGSAATGVAINWVTVGLSTPSQDWHGNSPSVGGVYDSGAVRLGSL